MSTAQLNLAECRLHPPPVYALSNLFTPADNQGRAARRTVGVRGALSVCRVSRQRVTSGLWFFHFFHQATASLEIVQCQIAESNHRRDVRGIDDAGVVTTNNCRLCRNRWAKQPLLH